MSKKEERLPIIIDLFLRPRGATVAEVCDRLSISRQMFYRYLQDLHDQGIAVDDSLDYDGNTNSKRWRIREDRFVRSFAVKLTQAERLMLRSVLDRTRMFTGTSLEPSMNNLKSKINAVTRYDSRRKITTAYASFKGGKDYSGKEEIIDTVLRAVEESLACRVTYRAAHAESPKTYEIEPYTFVDHGNALYCIAAIPAHNRDIRVLAIERIEYIELLEDTKFTVTDDYSPESYLGSSFGIIIEESMRVRVRFNPESALYARERVWGQEQHVENLADGAIVLSFTAAGRMEIKRWVLSFGSSARVLEPESLAKEIAEEAHRLSALYGSGNTDDIVT